MRAGVLDFGITEWPWAMPQAVGSRGLVWWEGVSGAAEREDPGD